VYFIIIITIGFYSNHLRLGSTLSKQYSLYIYPIANIFFNCCTSIYFHISNKNITSWFQNLSRFTKKIDRLSFREDLLIKLVIPRQILLWKKKN